jgi:isopenicillin N synthase-like dioxygenase
MTDTERAMYAYWREWFAQPLAAKMAHLRTPGRGGYYPAGSEGPGLEGGRDERKEYFHYRWRGGHPDSGQTNAYSLTELVFLDCLDRAHIWLSEHGLDNLIGNWAQRHVLRILHYLPSPDGCVGEAHRDFDLLTVSVEGTAPGLEIYEGRENYPNGWDRWTSQETGIQVGEMLEIYTRGYDREAELGIITPLTATTHRVRTAPNTERYKAVFFYLPPNDFELRPGFSAGDYLKDVLSKAGTYNVGQ